MKNLFRFIAHLLLVVLLTLVTQVGGVIYLLSLLINRLWKKQFKYKSFIVFVGVYIFSIYLVVPPIAKYFGREPVTHSASISPTNYATVLLNRNYVKPELNILLEQTATKLKGTAIEIKYLDANFPFMDGFPLLPHLSHNDGRKIDLSLIYETPKGEITNKKKSISGYGVFEAPNVNEYNQIVRCKSKGYFQYDYPKYVTFGSINDALQFSAKGTKKLIKTLLSNKRLGKLFIEPHLKHRLRLQNKKIRFHGCQAVRHDDHIHIQL